MSLLDQVRKLEQQVVDRLKELEPLTREYDQLRKLAERLGVKYTPSTEDSEDDTTPAPEPAPAAGRKRAAKSPARRSGKPRAARSPSAKPAGKAGTVKPTAKTGATKPDARKPRAAKARAAKPRGGRRSAAAPGQRQDDVLRLVGEQPGITVRELGDRLGVDATGLYRIVNRLSDEGRVRKDGSSVHPIAPEAPADASAAMAAEAQTPAPDAPTSETEADT